LYKRSFDLESSDIWILFIGPSNHAYAPASILSHLDPFFCRPRSP
jgi:hypothetical protein